MKQISGLVGGILRQAFFTIFGAAIGGGVLVWLKTNGIDLERSVADLLNIASSPKNLQIVLGGLVVFSGVFIGVVFYLLRQVIRRKRRPPLTVVREVRKVLGEIQEQCLSVAPEESTVSDILRRFRLLVTELHADRRLSSKLARVDETTNQYLISIAPGYSNYVDQDADGIHLLHQAALKAVADVFAATSWARGVTPAAS